MKPFFIQTNKIDLKILILIHISKNNKYESYEFNIFSTRY